MKIDPLISGGIVGFLMGAFGFIIGRFWIIPISRYTKMKNESIYYEMSYLEKRQKDKQFGKLCKTVM